MARLSAYLSHSIRGAKGDDATADEMDANNRRALYFAKYLRRCTPHIDLYVPAEHDEFVSEAMTAGDISIKRILKTDCKLLCKRTFLFVYVPDGVVSGGMQIEITEAQKHSIPVFFLFDLSKKTVLALKQFVANHTR